MAEEARQPLAQRLRRCANPLYIAAAAVVWDQLSKLAVRSYLHQGQDVPLCPCFNLTFRLNPGVAFSMLDHISAGRYILSGLALLVVLFILSLFWRGKAPRGRVAILALGLIMGGAIGNMIDRLLPPFYAVVDFLDFYWQSYHWPAFNVADICITTGALLLLIVSWREEK